MVHDPGSAHNLRDALRSCIQVPHLLVCFLVLLHILLFQGFGLQVGQRMADPDGGLLFHHGDVAVVDEVPAGFVAEPPPGGGALVADCRQDDERHRRQDHAAQHLVRKCGGPSVAFWKKMEMR